MSLAANAAGCAQTAHIVVWNQHLQRTSVSLSLKYCLCAEPFGFGFVKQSTFTDTCKSQPELKHKHQQSGHTLTILQEPQSYIFSVPLWKYLLITTINDYLYCWETISTAVLDRTTAAFCLISSPVLLFWLAEDLQMCLAITAHPWQLWSQGNSCRPSVHYGLGTALCSGHCSWSCLCMTNSFSSLWCQPDAKQF